jgi:hypothetical protein
MANPFGNRRFYYDSAKGDQLLIPNNIYFDLNQPPSLTPGLSSEAEEIKKFFHSVINLLQDKLNTPKTIARFIAEIAMQQNLVISYQRSLFSSQDNLSKNTQPLSSQASVWSVISLTDRRYGSASDLAKMQSISPLRLAMGKIIFSFLFALGALIGLAMIGLGILLIVNPQFMPLTFAALPLAAKIVALVSATIMTLFSCAMSAWFGYQAQQIRKNHGINYKPELDLSGTHSSYALLLPTKSDAWLNFPSRDSVLTSNSNFCGWLGRTECCDDKPQSRTNGLLIANTMTSEYY